MWGLNRVCRTSEAHLTKEKKRIRNPTPVAYNVGLFN
ncbi:hypothetical protein SAMN06265337_2941 [Hymenobacter gelipurpurascens]|uniref:Uncharacterized protein n=1 Tax=Hymenobacter gelipurpurascens TaxID=89968 RepID=A0A212UB98_9BACT|nr:hypothetical protein SAMN06265337_2941 [Hymenobacter gelipurpurascens]